MSAWEATGKSDEWYTPKYIFDSLGCEFDQDVAAPVNRVYCHVPALDFITEKSLIEPWKGFVWMNPPFGGRNGIMDWLNKIALHGDGIALTPDRTSAPWWQKAAQQADCVLFVAGKIKFIKPDGSLGKQPGTGTTLFGYGVNAIQALERAEDKDLGLLCHFRMEKIKNLKAQIKGMENTLALYAKNE